MPLRPVRPFLSAIAAGAFLVALVRAASPADTPYQRHQSAIEAFQQLAADAEAYIRRQIAAAASAPGGASLNAEELARRLTQARARLERHAGNLAAARREFDARRIDLETFVRRMHHALEWTTLEASRVQFEETRIAVSLLTHRQRQASRTLRDEHDGRAAPVRARPASPEREAALAQVRAEFAGRERTMLEAIIREYDAVTARLLERRREICGRLWQLQDFQEKRGRTNLAREIQGWIHALWEVDLRQRGLRFNTEGIDALVITHANANTIDWLQLLPAIAERNEREHYRHMDAALRAVPVEQLRRFDEDLPALAPRGEELQAMCEMLSDRLVRHFEVSARSRTLFNELRQAASRLPSNRAEPLPDPAPLASALESWQTQRIDFENARETARRAQEELTAREARLAQAREALASARRDLRLRRTTLRRAEANDRGAVSADELLREKERSIAQAEAQLRDEHVNAEQKRAIRAQLLPRLRQELQTVRDAIAESLGEVQRSHDSAQAEVERARQAVAAARPTGRAALAEAWTAVRTAADRARRQLPASARASMPELPYDQDAPRAEALAGQCLRGLQESIATLTAEQTALRNRLRENLSEMRRCDHELVELARSISQLRISALVTAERVLQELGAPAEDPMWTTVAGLRTDIGAVKELFDTADTRLGYLEKVRARLTGNETGAYLIEAVQERLGTVIAVLGFISDRIDNLDTLRTTHQQMQNPRTALAALATLLQTAGSAAESVPVLGGTMGRFLDFYARAATAAGNAAVAIQDHIIEQSLLLFTRQVPPERHLYIEDEIPATVPTSERVRVLKMLQVRRALALVAATTIEQARNASYRP